MTLKNQRLSLTLAPEFGSNLTSLRVGGWELIYTDREILKRHGFTGFFNLFPFPNRVRNKEYVFNGKKYSLKNLGPRFYHHAFARGLTWKFKKINQTQAETWLNHDQKSPCWKNFPRRCRLTLTYRLLKTGLKISYEVKNLDTAELGFGFGFHPLFKDAAAIKIPAKFVMAADKDLLPTGKLLPAKLNRLIPVKELDLDHVFTGLTGPQAVVFKNGLQLKITGSKDFTHCVVYTGEKDKYTAVEQQTGSTDAHNLDAQGFIKEAHLIRLKPGQTKTGWAKYVIL